MPVRPFLGRLMARKVPREDAPGDLYELEVRDLAGEPVPLERYRGQVTLVVNSASHCGFTPQYAELVELQRAYGDRGFTVLAFPSGDFGGQEFDDPAETRRFCDTRYGVDFPLLERSRVKAGPDQSPVFALLGGATGYLPGWNFGKYLVDRDGHARAFFPTPVRPTSPRVRAAIEEAIRSRTP